MPLPAAERAGGGTDITDYFRYAETGPDLGQSKRETQDHVQ